MSVPTIFSTCQPRRDVLEGTITEADFAADLAQFLKGDAPPEYLDPASFFANTFPTRGLCNLLSNVCRRLSGRGGESAAIFRLDTSYGGGKTHALIALAHAARNPRGVADIGEFLDTGLLPQGKVRIAAFDGENADPANGRRMGDGVLARTPWGELAYALAGKAGYERLRRSDEQRLAPGAETLRELFGGEPALILLDELSIYLRKVQNIPAARGQLTAFLTSLFKAVEGAPGASLVYTLALQAGRGSDAYRDENQFIADSMSEAESVSARKATLLNPTEDDETARVLRRRLFEDISHTQAQQAIEAYRALWSRHGDALSGTAQKPETLAAFRSSYPLHPEVLETFTGKTATLSNFQRVRGMLRLLAQTVAHMWKEKPGDATAIHLHHIALGNGPTRDEITTRLGQDALLPALTKDIESTDSNQKSLAQQLDDQLHKGLSPYAIYAARTIFMHTLAFNEPLRGLAPDHLRYAMLSPGLDISFIEEARTRFCERSAYLDDRPGTPLRFLAEANLNRILHRHEENVDPAELREELKATIERIFKGPTFDCILFPGGPYDVSDTLDSQGGGRPKLVVMSYDGVSVENRIDAVPELIENIYTRKGADGSALRLFRNNLAFVVAEEDRKREMRERTIRRIALRQLKSPENLRPLAEHQQNRVREWEARSEQEIASAIQRCYRHIFYPSKDGIGGNAASLSHTAIDDPSAAERPGDGQKQVIRTLQNLRKLRLPGDEPDSPAYVRDKTPLKMGQISTQSLRDEFRRNPSLPILIGNDIFLRGVEHAIQEGFYIYRRGEMLFGPNDPAATIHIDDQATLFTMDYARQNGIWPRPEAETVPPPTEPPIQTQLPPKPGDGNDTLHETPPSVFSADAILEEALKAVWEKARSAGAAKISTLAITAFDANDSFRLLPIVGAASGARKEVSFKGEYETQAGGYFQCEFKGPVEDAQPVREFLAAQFRAARGTSLNASFTLHFEDGLPLSGDAPEVLTGQLTRFSGSAVHVSAAAEAML